MCAGEEIRWYRTQQVLDSLVAANIAALIIAGFYYAVTQVDYRIPGFSLFAGSMVLHHGFTVAYLKPTWDNLFSGSAWPVYRHGLRDLYEPIVATFFVKSLMAKWKHVKQERLGARQLVLRSVLVFVVSLPLVVAGLYLINFGLPSLWHREFHKHVIGNPVHLPHAASFAGTFLASWPWQLLLLGIIIGQVVHRIYAPVGSTVQGFFLDRQCDKAHDAIDAGDDRDQAISKYAPRWPTPPLVRERYWWVMLNNLPVRDRQRNIALVVRAGSILCLLLFLTGIYARYWIAKGH
jgi:hypothetical protein